MPLHRSLRAAALTALGVGAVALGGCASGQATGGAPLETEAVREGLFHDLGGLDYKVFITRQLNLRDPEDRDYFQGPEAPPGSTYYGVFIQVCNEGERSATSADTMKIVDTQGDEFEPIELPRTNIFAYRPGRLAPKECIPNEVSIAGTGPTGGALLVFLIPQAAQENRPLELEIEGAYNAEGERQAQAFELDI